MTYDEYMQQLMMGAVVPWTQTDPYAPTVQPYNAVGGSVIAPAMDKKGNILPMDVANQAKAFNATQDYLNIQSDPAFLAMIGGESPGAGTTTYQPMPQLMSLINAAQNPSTIEGLIADEILNGGSYASALSKIKDKANPDSANYNQEFAALVPTYTKTDQGISTQAIDEDYLKTIGSQFQSAYLSVPRDPTTGQPAYVIDPTTGMPSMAVTKPDELGQWYQDTNTPLPTDQYSPDLLATPQQLATRDALPGRMEDAMKRMADLDRARKVLLSQPGSGVMAPAGGVHPMRPSGQPGYHAPGADAGNMAAVGAYAANPAAASVGLIGRAIGAIPGAGTVDSLWEKGKAVAGFGADKASDLAHAGVAIARGPVHGNVQGSTHPGGIQQAMLQAQMAGQRGLLQKNNVASLQAYGDKERARQDQLQSDYDNKMRQKMIEALAAQGHTPNIDTLARRRAMAQYAGFGI